jgi:thymidine kinase
MSVHVVVGPMFAGKTSYIRNLVSKYNIIHVPTLLITHPYGRDKLSWMQHRAEIESLTDLEPLLLHQYKVIIIDEAQFFIGIKDFVRRMADDYNKDVYVVGLDGDCDRNAFGEVLQCIPLANTVTKLSAFCERCANGTPGIFTFRKNDTHGQQIMPGGAESYGALCRECWLHTEV